MGLLDFFRKKPSAPQKSDTPQQAAAPANPAPAESDTHHFPEIGKVYQIGAGCTVIVLAGPDTIGKGNHISHFYCVRDLYSGELCELQIRCRTDTSPRTYITYLNMHTARPNAVLTDPSLYYCYRWKWENVEYHPRDFQRIICMHDGNRSYTDVATGKEYYNATCQESKNVPKGTLVSAYLYNGIGYFGACHKPREKGLYRCIASDGQLLLRSLNTQEILEPNEFTVIFNILKEDVLKEGALYGVVDVTQFDKSVNPDYPTHLPEWLFPNTLMLVPQQMLTQHGQYLYDDGGMSHIMNLDTYDMASVPADCMPAGVQENDIVEIQCVAGYNFWTQKLPREYYEIRLPGEAASVPAAPVSADVDCAEYDDPQVSFTLGEENNRSFELVSSDPGRFRPFSLYKSFTTFVDEGLQPGDRIYVDTRFDPEEDASLNDVYRYRKSLLKKMNVIPGKEIAIYQGFSEYSQAFMFKLLSADRNEIKPVYLSDGPVIEGNLRIGECVRLETHYEDDKRITRIIEDRETTQEWQERAAKR